MKVLLDCDNTFGIPDHDVDDGLALLYLLGREEVDVLGVTCTFGNADVDTVFRNTRRFLHEIGRAEIPCLRGGTPEEPDSPAARFLADTVRRNRGEVTLLATGALTNLCGAHRCDPSFFTHVSRIVTMGGITSPLVIGGQTLDELNFSRDPRATQAVLSCRAPLTVITANLCLQALFGHDEFLCLEANRHVPVNAYLLEALYPWRRAMEQVFGLQGFHNWDTTAAVYVTDPSLFRDQRRRLTSSLAELSRGFLCTDESRSGGHTVNMPSAILDPEAFNRSVLDAWQRTPLRKGEGDHEGCDLS
jgi:inosine-uridine nucleoside N-ribohydrolase